MNKNISIWRGSNTPPTLNHLWIDEANNIKININNEWVSLLEIIQKQWDNIVTLEDDQTITGNKIFTSPINLNNRSVIKSSIGNGEFKVTHYNSEKGFIIRTKWSDDKNILPLEMLSTNGYTASHLYKFPEKSGTLLVDSDMQSFKDDINTSITAETSQRISSDTALGNRINNIENNVIPKAVAEGIAEVVANAPEDLDTLKEVADYIASDKTKASQIETALSDLKKSNTQNATNIAKNASDITANTEELAKQAKELTTKAPKVGYAPDLKVDFAKELVGRGVAEPQEIGAIRPTGVISIGDGNATIEKVKGQSVVWNQLATRKIFNHSAGGITITSDADGNVRITGDNASETTVSYKVCGKKGVKGHKFLMTANGLTGWNKYGLYDTKIGSESCVSSIGYVFYTAKEEVSIYIAVWTGVFVDTQTKPYIYDLTQMFGAGNEPTTIEEFYARKPLGVSNDYNEGEIISYDAKELKSVGFNAFNGSYANVIGGQQYHALGTITSIGFTTELGGETTDVTLDSEGMFTPTEDGYVYAEGTDICIHLTHTYTPEHTTKYEKDTLRLPDVKAIKDKDGNPLFPYGLLSAGRVHDEITSKKAVKRMGVVDMGTLQWRYLSSDNAFEVRFEYKINGAICAKYPCEYTTSTSKWLNDKTLYYGHSTFSIGIKDSSYTDVASFKAAMSGVMLYYQLKNPIEVDLPEPLNLTYDAWDFGTEELVAEGKTTPLNADIVYQFNAVDRIRENTAKNQALETELAELKAQLTQLTQVTNDEKNNV